MKIKEMSLGRRGERVPKMLFSTFEVVEKRNLVSSVPLLIL